MKCRGGASGLTNVYGLLPSTQQENETIKAATVIGCGRISGLFVQSGPSPLWALIFIRQVGADLLWRALHEACPWDDSALPDLRSDRFTHYFIDWTHEV